MYKNNRVLLTGANGFIGSHILDKLSSIGYSVYPMPREVLRDAYACYDFTRKLKPNYIIHTASYGNQHYQTDPKEILGANVNTTANLLSGSHSVKYKAFIYLSSSSVYGNKTEPMRETDYLGGNTPYALAKIQAEKLCAKEAETGKPVIIVRPFSVYGNGEQPHRLIPSICRSIDTSEKMKLTPDSMHDWIHINDFVNAIVVLMKKSIEPGDIFNVGSGKQYSNFEILEKIEWITDKNAKYELCENQRPEEKSCWVADITRLKSLGWKPELDIIKGLKKTINLSSIQEYA